MNEKVFIALGTAITAIVVSTVLVGNFFPDTLMATRPFFDRLLGMRNHYLPCDQLPRIQDVHKVVREHRGELEAFIRTAAREYRGEKDISPTWQMTTVEGSVKDGDPKSYIWVSWGEKLPECRATGRGDIVLYDPGQGKKLWEKTFGTETFFGIPYRIFNI